MIPDSHQIYCLVFDDIVCVFSLRITGIVQPIPFHAISGVDNEKVAAVGVCPLAQMLRERDVVAPISSVLGLLLMTAMPAMRVCCV
jgi:hypothetical protein